MKLPKAEKLKSGSYRIQLQIDGKRYSVTGKTKKDAQDAAKQIYAGAQLEKRIPLTVGKAIDNYIEEKKGTLSPSTIQGYKVARRNYLQSIMKTNITDLAQSDVQIAVGEDAVKGKSPKTIRNAHGLLAAVLDQHRPNFVLKTRLPQKKVYDVKIPSEEEMKKIWVEAKGSNYELPILLASWMGLRMSEIRGLRYCDVRDGRLHIHSAIVYGPDGDVEKGTKTTAGDRWLKLPEDIQKLIDAQGVGKDQQDHICPYTDGTIYRNFKKFCDRAGVPSCRFHDLRHFAASEAHALGVPDKYSMRRMGHKTDNMLKTVYQHTMRDKEDAFSDVIDQKMQNLYRRAHENSHGDEKKP